MRNLSVKNVISVQEVEAIVKADKVSKSEKIRQLFNGGLDLNQIKDAVGVRYNFVYNVLQNYTIVNDIPVEKVERTSKRSEIVELLHSGKSLADVSRATKVNYNYIWKIAKEEGLTKKENKVEVKAEV